MSSPETLAPVVLSAQELLLHFNEDQLVQLLNDSRNESGGFDISRVVGVDDLSKDEREAFSKKLRYNNLDTSAVPSFSAEVTCC